MSRFRKPGKNELYERALSLARSLPDHEFAQGGCAYWRIMSQVASSAPANLSDDDVRQAVGKAVRVRRGELR